MSTSAPRHSLYPATAHLAPSYGAPQQSASLSSLASCVASVELSCQTVSREGVHARCRAPALTLCRTQLESSVAMLQSATADMPRLAKVLASKRHFDLVSERDIRSAREHLSAEIAPQLRELIPLAEQALEREEKVVKSLKSKVSVSCWRVPFLPAARASGAALTSASLHHSTSKSQHARRS